MGMITDLIEKRSTLKNPADWLVKALIGQKESASGVNVTEKNAMKYSAVFACVRILAETVGSLPLKVYERDGRSKYPATDHYLYSKLHKQPNDHMTSIVFREVMMTHLGLWGNAYAEIERRGGRVHKLWPIPPNRVEPFVYERTGNKWYNIELPDEENRVVSDEDMLHIVGLSLNGLKGLSPVGMAKESIGLGLAAEEFGARFFSQGTNIGGVVSHPETLSEKAFQTLRGDLQEKYEGLGKSHRLMLLEEGMQYESVGIPPDDAQFLESREFQLREIARIYRIPPHMIADLENATFSNIEHQSIDFVVHTIRPWLVRWEQAINTSLFGKSDRDQHFTEFIVDGLLRGDTETRFDAYAIARQWGWMSANDVRELENMNPIDGGDSYLVPMNMIPANRVDDMIGEEIDDDDEEGENRQTKLRRAIQKRSATQRSRIASSFERTIEDAAERVVKREVKNVKKAAKKHLGERSLDTWEAWLADFYREFPDFIERHMEAPFEGLEEAITAATADEVGIDDPADLSEFREAYLTAYVERHVDSSRGQIDYVVAEALDEEEDPAEMLVERMDEWEERRPEKVAKNESVQAGNAFAKAAFVSYGVTKLRWVAIGAESCEFCQEMDGKVVGIEQDFLGRDEQLDAEGREDGDMKIYRPVGHPPLHPHCVCTIAPE